MLAPTLELAAQTALTLYAAVGGSVRGTYVPDDGQSMFKYTGPKGVRVAVLLSPADVDRARAPGRAGKTSPPGERAAAGPVGSTPATGRRPGDPGRREAAQRPQALEPDLPGGG